jgi:hypothetical protein
MRTQADRKRSDGRAGHSVPAVPRTVGRTSGARPEGLSPNFPDPIRRVYPSLREFTRVYASLSESPSNSDPLKPACPRPFVSARFASFGYFAVNFQPRQTSLRDFLVRLGATWFDQGLCGSPLAIIRAIRVSPLQSALPPSEFPRPRATSPVPRTCFRFNCQRTCPHCHKDSAPGRACTKTHATHLFGASSCPPTLEPSAIHGELSNHFALKNALIFEWPVTDIHW